MIFPGRFPPGTRFDPTETQLITDYLWPKACDPRGFKPGAVLECDLYDDEEKWKHWFDLTGESRLYFFTRLKKKKKEEKGQRVERSFGQSVWKSQRDYEIRIDPEDKESLVIGKKRTFSYKVKTAAEDGGGGSSRESENNGWVMHEFTLDGDLAKKFGGGGCDCYVICCVRKKEERSGSSGDERREIELIDPSMIQMNFGQ
ncbi:unnamed protein product [Linum tenue]|uniref:NAC domain-containing protein n=1 Tax=Linum tenue TaxID=586396 RepID=A0AAV0IPK3_9ROSI|nr:unnamed protein product [Linum tenue]CAI0398952.1 unnamed protein product [Linum tenue]